LRKNLKLRSALLVGTVGAFVYAAMAGFVGKS
jgi:hypothetical protein